MPHSHSSTHWMDLLCRGYVSPRTLEFANSTLHWRRPEDAQYWHDLARIATEDTDKIKDRYESLQKQSDSFRVVAEKGNTANQAIADSVFRAEDAETKLSLYEDRVERSEAKLLMEQKRREDAELQLDEMRKQLDDIQRSLVNVN